MNLLVCVLDGIVRVRSPTQVASEVDACTGGESGEVRFHFLGEVEVADAGIIHICIYVCIYIERGRERDTHTETETE